MVTFPFCKINLGLHVLSKREDGFHNLETCFFPVPWTDILEIIPASALSLTVSGTHIPPGTGENICLKAWHLLKREHPEIPAVAMHLHKVIPVGGGLAGGSSDGAFALMTMNTLFNLNIPSKKLNALAAGLGSDCAFFLKTGPQLASGRGEVLEPVSLPLSGYYLVIIKPDTHVSTADAFKNISPQTGRTSVAEIVAQPPQRWREKLINDFEPSVFAMHPSIGKIKSDLYDLGATYASMTGSGAAVFGLFRGEVDLTRFSYYKTFSVLL